MKFLKLIINGKKMTKVIILSGNNGLGKSAYLHNLYLENPFSSIFFDDFECFLNISRQDLISREQSRGQVKYSKLLQTSKKVLKKQNLIIDDIDTYLHNDILVDIIQNILDKNPNIKNLIVSTHSPMLIMKKWQDCVINIDDIDYEEFKKYIDNI